MSFEGYEQVLCENGHYFTFDAYDFWKPESWKCHCGGKAVWSNLVDLTNGSFDEKGNRIDRFIYMEPLEEVKCPTCGHLKECRYKVPKKGGRKIDGH